MAHKSAKPYGLLTVVGTLGVAGLFLPPSLKRLLTSEIYMSKPNPRRNKGPVILFFNFNRTFKMSNSDALLAKLTNGGFFQAGAEKALYRDVLGKNIFRPVSHVLSDSSFAVPRADDTKDELQLNQKIINEGMSFRLSN